MRIEPVRMGLSRNTGFRRVPGSPLTGWLASVTIAIAVLCAADPSSSVTLDDAIRRGFEVSFIVKEQKETVNRSQYSYMSTIDPYLPRVDIQSYYINNLNGQTSAGQGVITVPTVGGFSNTFAAKELFTFTGTITYRLFDGGERYARRKQAYSLLGREKEILKGKRADVLYNVKTAFYSALGSKSVVGARRDAYRAAERVYDLTTGRFAAGVAKKSEVLQAEVRKTTAHINVLDSVKQYERSLEEFKSLLLYSPLDSQDVEGPFEEPTYSADFQALVARAVSVRPDVTAQEKEIERLNMVYKERASNWFPRIDAMFQQTRFDTQFFPDGRQDALLINFTYALFDGVGRYYNMKGAVSDISAARYRLGEIRRSVELEIVRALKDYELSRQNVQLYRELVREAASNFDQAYGEYRVGKGDILALLQSERELAGAKENYITAISRANTSLAYLERVAYLEGD